MYGFLNKIIYEWIGLGNNDVADLKLRESQTTADLNNVVYTGNQTFFFFLKKTQKMYYNFFFLIFKYKFPRIQTGFIILKLACCIQRNIVQLEMYFISSNVTDTDAVGSELLKSAFQACWAW